VGGNEGNRAAAEFRVPVVMVVMVRNAARADSKLAVVLAKSSGLFSRMFRLFVFFLFVCEFRLCECRAVIVSH
jgi:hypothetical protein